MRRGCAVQDHDSPGVRKSHRAVPGANILTRMLLDTRLVDPADFLCHLIPDPGCSPFRKLGLDIWACARLHRPRDRRIRQPAGRPFALTTPLRGRPPSRQRMLRWFRMACGSSSRYPPPGSRLGDVCASLLSQ